MKSRLPSTQGSQPPSETAQRFEELIRSARSGDSKTGWLDALIRKSGYVKLHGTEESDVVLCSIKQLARGFGVTPKAIRLWKQDGLPVYRESRGPRPALYDVFAVVRWWKQREEARMSSDPLLLGGNSHWLEEYRRQRAREARRRNDVEENKLIEKAELDRHLRELSRLFRQQAEGIQRTHGGAAGESIRELVSNVLDSWQKLMGGEDGEDESEDEADRAGEDSRVA